MNNEQIRELLYKHSLLDPDYLVDVLGITSEEILDKFYTKFIAYIKEEYADDERIYEDG